ncbi:isoprenylcysteine carboxyl methyltransferase [Photobacterium aquae]|uniref:Isoprenylcysteine carboxyl methyltransferase n=1 Tax=Photobacterium aquae TaxID=1195763 RepID=A0A0J1GZX2_9GAMM|nr:isoprenylcysteine carboxylmethyltransferase family protein [Photobacterium aquae]KLV05115.1 isoprenylcysteine carboxyl methyltransferase [Photobacterium aquae]
MYLRLPPPLVMLLTLAGMYGLASYWPIYQWHFTGQLAVILVLCLLGAVIGLAGVVAFAQVQTTIDPRFPNKTSSLVTFGIYRYSRNPMYLGLLCWLIAACLYFSALSPFLMLVVFVFYMNHFQIAPEEAVLQAMFGEDYTAYCQQVRRWC